MWDLWVTDYESPEHLKHKGKYTLKKSVLSELILNPKGTKVI